MIKSRDYQTFIKRFNSLSGNNKKGFPQKYTVSNYNADKWQNEPFGKYKNPLVPSIFKELGC